MTQKGKKIKNPAGRDKVFVAMSGGVDSSVAALLLQKPQKMAGSGVPTEVEGYQKKDYDLVGCFIKGWQPSGIPCTQKEDRRDAMKVCAKLGIPFITVDAEKEYKEEVVDYMIREYKAGRTPNPDVMCNKNVKFGIFLKKALEMGADYIATGHYVRLSSKEKVVSNKESHTTYYMLHTASDHNKDQSYFLWTLTQDQLKYCLFPLGELTKPEVRKIAEENDLVTANKKDSQGVCFIGEFDMKDFLQRYIEPKSGDIVTVNGEKIGEHEGVMFYTIGQRHGLGGLRSAKDKGDGSIEPYFVVAKDIEKNQIIVANDKKEEERFYKKDVSVTDISWISGEEPDLSKAYLARIRYRQPLQECKISSMQNVASSKGKYKITFIEPQKAVSPGQSLVVYTKDGEMLGGGVIAG